MATMQDVWNEIDRRDQATLEAALRAMGISTSADSSGSPPASSGGLPIHNNLHHEPPLAIASDLAAHIATIADATTLGHVKGGDNVEIAPDGTMSVTVSGFMDFLDLGDVDAPSGYVGQAGRVPRVKGDETGLELHLLTAADVGALTQTVADTLYDYLGAADDAIAAHVAELDPHPQYLTSAEADALFLTPAEGNAAYVALSSVSAFGFTLIDDADAAAARTTLGLAAGGAGDIWVERAGDTMTGDLLIQKASALLTVQASSGGANLTVQSDVGNANINFSSAQNSQSQLNFNTLDTGVAEGRWLFLKNNDTESGSNVGANFEVRRRNDAGNALGTVLFLVRETGFVGINRNVASVIEYQLDINGTFRVDATTGGVATLFRTSNIGAADLPIGRLAFANSDSSLTTQQLYGYIEVQSAASITTDAARGKMLFAVTPNTVTSAPVVRLTIEEDGRIHGSALHNNAGAVTGTTNQYLASGTYTPTLDHTTNVAASTAYVCQWVRVGNVVTVSGKVDVDPTAAVATVLGISLPIASNLANLEDCAGAGASPAVAGLSGAILSNVANNRAELQWLAVDTANRSWYFTFTYEVL